MNTHCAYPSPTAADTGVAFARGGNRFWPAALRAGLVSADRDPRSALVDHGVGFTDVAKRTTAAASDLGPDEITEGLIDLDLKMRWARPSLVVVLGVPVWTSGRPHRGSAVGTGRDGDSAIERIGGCPVQVLPNPSGRNAHVTLDDMVGHLTSVVERATRSR